MTTLYLDVHVPSSIAAESRRWGVDVVTAREGWNFAELLFGHQLHGSIGQYVRDLDHIAQATDPADWIDQVEQLPLRQSPMSISAPSTHTALPITRKLSFPCSPASAP